MDDERTAGTLSTIERTFEILDRLKQTGGMTLTELSNDLGLATSTVFNYVRTLERIEWVTNDDGEYYLSMKFYEFGSAVKRSLDLVGKAEPILSELANQTNEAAWIIVEDHGWVVFMESATGKRGVPTQATKGDRSHMHCQAAGKAILAHYQPEEVHAILDRRGMPRKTEHTITDRETLFDELDDVAKSGIAFNDEESVSGLRAVAAPVFRDGDVLASISIPGPAKRFTGEYFREELPDRLEDASNELDLNLRYADT